MKHSELKQLIREEIQDMLGEKSNLPTTRDAMVQFMIDKYGMKDGTFNRNESAKKIWTYNRMLQYHNAIQRGEKRAPNAKKLEESPETGIGSKSDISGRLNWKSKLTPEQENILDQNNLWKEMDKIFHEIEYDVTGAFKKGGLLQFVITNASMDTWDGEIPQVINVKFEVWYNRRIDYLNATFKFGQDGYPLNYDYA